MTKVSDNSLKSAFERLDTFKQKTTSIQKRRFDKLFKNLTKDRKNKRRGSFTSYTKNMWQFVKINHFKRFKDMSPFGINKILEVKDIESLRGQSKSDDAKIDITKLRMKKLREYAFVGEDNVIFLFSLHTMQIQKLLSADSHAVGVYYDSIYNYYFVLTKELNMLFYSKITLALERRGDFQDASQILCLDDIIQSIFSKEDMFQSKDMTIVSNISIDHPLNYNDLSIYSSKYTKALHDFLKLKPNLRDYESNEVKRKAMLKTLNSILYLNNHLYNSDANETDFKRSGVNFVKAHIGTRTKRGNLSMENLDDNKQIMRGNNQQVINIHSLFYSLCRLC